MPLRRGRSRSWPASCWASSPAASRGRGGHGPPPLPGGGRLRLVVSAAGNPLAALTDLLLMGQDIGFHVVLARRVGGATRSAFEPFFQRLREDGHAGSDPERGPLRGPPAGRAPGQPLPPGRGLLVRPPRRRCRCRSSTHRRVNPQMARVRPGSAGPCESRSPIDAPRKGARKRQEGGSVGEPGFPPRFTPCESPDGTRKARLCRAV